MATETSVVFFDPLGRDPDFWIEVLESLDAVVVEWDQEEVGA